MKTITFNKNSVSAYIFDNEHDLVATSESITCPHFVISDMNIINATVHNNVTPPIDWQGGKYAFDGADWTVVVGWVDPKVAELERLQAEIVALEA